MRLFTIFLIALALLFIQILPALAADGCPSPSRAFGEHLAEVTPEHPREMAKQFGECVSMMARGIPCPDCPH